MPKLRIVLLRAHVLRGPFSFECAFEHEANIASPFSRANCAQEN